MHRTAFLLCVVLTCVACAPSAVNAAERPNILWISCEDISPSLGCYGDRYSTSPHVDRLAGQGVVFRRCFSHAGVCAVARAGPVSYTHLTLPTKA